uniref:Pentatricopeptide repeat-containing protein n=1 Tax=Kalanchoe fedtschenkoi TaxID=63787 RepID=A0A7N0SVD4_KALFE
MSYAAQSSKLYRFIRPHCPSLLHFDHRFERAACTLACGSSLGAEDALVIQFASMLQKCAHPHALGRGREVHAQAIVNGIWKNPKLGPKILGMYVLCERFSDAKTMFYRLDLSYALCWNWMIRGLTAMGWFKFAVGFFLKMLSYGASPDKYTFPYVIKACGGLRSLRLGKLVHEMIVNYGFVMDVFVGSALVKFYAETGCIVSARRLFDEMPERDAVLWNVMLNGYAKVDDHDNAIGVYEQMCEYEVKPNSVTFTCILSVCCSKVMMDFGSKLHGLIVKHGFEQDSSVANTLLAMYAKCRRLSDARRLFETGTNCDLVSWNAMISGYVQNGLMDEASHLFRKMISSGIKPDSITFASFLPSICEVSNLNHGKEVQGYVIRHTGSLDAFLQSALIDIYCKCKDVETAGKIFYLSTKTDVVVCTTMISGNVLNGRYSDAIENFQLLLQGRFKPNAVTLASVLPACGGMVALRMGKELHNYILKNGHDNLCYVCSAVMDMYAKCGRLDLAGTLFTQITHKDVASWNAMIANCSQNGKPEEAINLFRQMGKEGTQYDCVSISAALSACATLPALHLGKEIHALMIKDVVHFDLFGASALIDVYAKCGKLSLAHQVFEMMQERNEITWNSIIAAFGNHGCLKECLHLFNEMLKDGFQPDHVTFLAIISACGHAGRVDEGIYYFYSMMHEHGIKARMEHYACVVDLFGRAGRLSEAIEVIKSMPFDADGGVWGTLLGACRVHNNVELAVLASKHLIDLDPQNSGYYMLMANLHADAGQWESVRKIRDLMKNQGVQKVPGYSWLESSTTTHMFIADDKTHPESEHIYSVLKHLMLETRKEGSEPQLFSWNSATCQEDAVFPSR